MAMRRAARTTAAVGIGGYACLQWLGRTYGFDSPRTRPVDAGRRPGPLSADGGHPRGHLRVPVT